MTENNNPQSAGDDVEIMPKASIRQEDELKSNSAICKPETLGDNILETTKKMIENYKRFKWGLGDIRIRLQAQKEELPFLIDLVSHYELPEDCHVKIAIDKRIELYRKSIALLEEVLK